ncbi:MAG TPA: hypothetical protein VNT26_22755, partial [Candidatus Sulfotelmatobacter sp.]|nr:hypothetical protein [Candidatus Sulfotelmatobacter sp.]
IAAKDAIQADIIIISSHGGSELPSHVKKWLETWVSEGSQALALVALFDCPREEAERTRTIRAYLSGVAKRAKLEFFAQPDDWPGHKRDESLLGFQRSSDLNEKTLCTLAGVVQRDVSVPRWSISD